MKPSMQVKIFSLNMGNHKHAGLDKVTINDVTTFVNAQLESKLCDEAKITGARYENYKKITFTPSVTKRRELFLYLQKSLRIKDVSAIVEGYLEYEECIVVSSYTKRRLEILDFHIRRSNPDFVLLQGFQECYCHDIQNYDVVYDATFSHAIYYKKSITYQSHFDAHELQYGNSLCATFLFGEKMLHVVSFRCPLWFDNVSSSLHTIQYPNGNMAQKCIQLKTNFMAQFCQPPFLGEHTILCGDICMPEARLVVQKEFNSMFQDAWTKVGKTKSKSTCVVNFGKVRTDFVFVSRNMQCIAFSLKCKEHHKSIQTSDWPTGTLSNHYALVCDMLM